VKIPVVLISMLLCGCFYGSEFIDGEELQQLAAKCGVSDFRINHENGADYLDLPAGTTNPDAVKTCIERSSNTGTMALVRVDESYLAPAVAAEIETVCGLSKGALTEKTSIPGDAMPKMTCAVEEARKRGVNFGFISNPVQPDAQTH
jgi:hypothetical protein